MCFVVLTLFYVAGTGRLSLHTAARVNDSVKRMKLSNYVSESNAVRLYCVVLALSNGWLRNSDVQASNGFILIGE